MKTILLPTDFSTIADNALNFANAIANRQQARIILLHTYHVSVFAVPEVGYAQVASIEEMEQDLDEKLQGMCTNLQQNFPNVTYESKVTSGALVDVLPIVAKEIGADLIVMGTEGAHGVKQVLMSTQSAEICSIACCPVLVIPLEAHFRGIEQIVFATDLFAKPSSDIQVVVDMARLFDAEILFVYIPVNSHIEFSDEDWEKFYQQLAYDKVSFHVQQGKNIEDGIRSFTENVSADIVVMINYRRRFWDQLFVVSQTKQMAYHTKLPLLVLHA